MKHKIAETSIQKDTTIRLTFEHGGWANMSFIKMQNKWTNVVISSDWGNWEYGWSDGGFGDRTLYQAMGKKEISYFRNKFFGATPSVFNNKKTLTEFRKIIRKEVKWINEREKHEELMYQISELEGCETADALHYGITKELTEVLGDEFWFLFRYEAHPRTAYFSKHIFPKFFKEIKKLSEAEK